MRSWLAQSVIQLYGDDADWVQGYGSYTSLAKAEMIDKLCLLGLSGSKQLLCIHMLMAWFNPSTWRQVPSNKELAKLTNRSERTVRRLKQELVEEHLIKIKLPRGWPEGKPTGAPDRVDLTPLLRALRKVNAPSPTLRIVRDEEAPEKEEDIPVAAAAPPQDALDDTLVAIAAQFGESLGNPGNARKRIHQAQARAGWEDEELLRAIRLAAKQAKEKAQDRKFSLFFADLDRRADETLLRRRQREQEEAIMDEYFRAERAWLDACEEGDEATIAAAHARYLRAVDVQEALFKKYQGGPYA